MKFTLYILFIFSICSCSSSRVEKKIVNDFICEEINSKRYEAYKNFDFLLLQNAGNAISSLSAYEYSFKNKNAYSSKARQNKSGNHENTYWILDSLQIEKIKLKKENKEIYFWNKDDIKCLNLEIITSEQHKKNFMNKIYLKKSCLILYISKPLIINHNSALIYFSSENASGILSNIEHYGVLLKKERGKWVKDIYFEDSIIY